jgi:hypothetical protein
MIEVIQARRILARRVKYRRESTDANTDSSRVWTRRIRTRQIRLRIRTHAVEYGHVKYGRVLEYGREYGHRSRTPSSRIREWLASFSVTSTPQDQVLVPIARKWTRL